MPFDVIRKRMQIQGPQQQAIVQRVPVYAGVTDCFRSIVKHEGAKGLFRGLAPSILKSAPSTAVTFFVVEQMRAIFDN
jgi:Mitochondrial carrier protein